MPPERKLGTSCLLDLQTQSHPVPVNSSQTGYLPFRKLGRIPNTMCFAGHRLLTSLGFVLPSCATLIQLAKM